jgi:hypothetical protein
MKISGVGMISGLLGMLLVGAAPARAQSNFEIQVYPGTTVPKGVTMLELHSNFTGRGSTTVLNGVLPSNHALHETIELTHGFADWLEIGFYQFVSFQDAGGVQYVGNHIRPRIAVPERLKWPIGLSLSQEVGYNRKAFGEDTWSWEFRPIIDQTIGRFYWSFNPALGISLKGPNAGKSPDFEPNAQIGFDATKRVNVALEYFGGLGPLNNLEPLKMSQQLLVPALNIDFGPEWEFNIGAGIALTDPTDRVTLKMIMGRKLGGRKSPPK